MTPLAQHQHSVGAALGRRIAAGAVVAGLGLALWVPAAVAQDRRAPNPEVLTERFPLEGTTTAPRSATPPATSEPAAPSSRQAAPPAPAAEPAGDSSGGSMTLVLIIAAVVLLAVGFVVGRALRRRWLRNSEPPIPPWRGSRPAPDGRAGVGGHGGARPAAPGRSRRRCRERPDQPPGGPSRVPARHHPPDTAGTRRPGGRGRPAAAAPGGEVLSRSG